MVPGQCFRVLVPDVAQYAVSVLVSATQWFVPEVRWEGNERGEWQRLRIKFSYLCVHGLAREEAWVAGWVTRSFGIEVHTFLLFTLPFGHGFLLALPCSFALSPNELIRSVRAVWSLL